MPIYEYYCFDCRKRVSVLFRTMAEADAGGFGVPRLRGGAAAAADEPAAGAAFGGEPDRVDGG